MTFGINTECSPEKNKGNQVGNKVKQSYQFELAAWSFNRPALSWLRGSIRRYRFMMFYFIKKTTMQVKNHGELLLSMWVLADWLI
ncbi:hypothetical protein JE934_003594 [Yersinia ruckeri]|nr:hypothetical protein [Yersinia ruckeri]EKN4693461.1 hypothetical protein [Yersinia ruckeri]